jgi:hypothetical protein
MNCCPGGWTQDEFSIGLVWRMRCLMNQTNNSSFTRPDPMTAQDECALGANCQCNRYEFSPLSNGHSSSPFSPPFQLQFYLVSMTLMFPSHPCSRFYFQQENIFKVLRKICRKTVWHFLYQNLWSLLNASVRAPSRQDRCVFLGSSKTGRRQSFPCQSLIEK